MSEIITVGLDLAKNVFQAHGADASGRAVLRKKLSRHQVLEFFGQLPACVVAMEACVGAHFWGREIGKLGLPRWYGCRPSPTGIKVPTWQGNRFWNYRSV
jgi:hypothetical protein